LNAGLLALPVVAVFYITWKNRGQLSDSEKLLWLWLMTVFVVFSLPSQRSERYLLPAMPALALLCALNWHRIDRKVFVASLATSGAILALLAYLSLRLEQGAGDLRLYPVAYWCFLIGAGAFIFLALFVPRFTLTSVITATFLVYLGFAAFLRPFDGSLGRYDATVQSHVKGRDVWVPINFRAKEEGFRFLLPGANVRPYYPDQSQTIASLSSMFPVFAIRLPMNATNFGSARILGHRLVLGSRHTSSQIKEMAQGRVLEHLFLRELLIEAPRSKTKAVVAPSDNGER
jgi:hypothetical protein